MGLVPDKAVLPSRRAANRARAHARPHRRVRARAYIPGARYKVTRVTLERRMFLAPDERNAKKLNNLIGYLLSHACDRSGVRICAVTVMSNHIHIDVWDPRGELPLFKSTFFALLARKVNTLLERSDNLWSGSGKCDTTPCDDLVFDEGDALESSPLDGLVYTLTNPVKDGLVKHGDRWPGFTSYGWKFGETREFKRPDWFFTAATTDMPSKLSLTLHRPADILPELSDAQLDAELTRLLHRREAYFQSRMREQNRRFVGEKNSRGADGHAPRTPRVPALKLSPRSLARTRLLDSGRFSATDIGKPSTRPPTKGSWPATAKSSSPSVAIASFVSLAPSWRPPRLSAGHSLRWRGRMSGSADWRVLRGHPHCVGARRLSERPRSPGDLPRRPKIAASPEPGEKQIGATGRRTLGRRTLAVLGVKHCGCSWSRVAVRVKYVLKTSTPRGTGLDLDKDLNVQQRAVVQAPPKQLLVLAGAGTGKTRTLTYRVARLVKMGCPPDRIMLVTFTNRAAREMVARVEAILGIDMRTASAGTFHHVGHKLLRKYGEAIGLSPDFGILDPEDARDLIGGVVAQEGLPALTTRRLPQPRVLASVISLANGVQRDIKDVVDRRYPRFVDQAPFIERIAGRYALRKRKLNVCDFDDLLSLWLKLMRSSEHSALAETIRGAHDHVLVDEYQDINALQGALVDEMSKGHGSLTCVGDDAQSIYSFRGADFQQIFRFNQRHRDAEIMRLTINYRSTPQILELANRSIARNEQQHPKELTAVRPASTKPAVIPLRDVYQQAELVAQRVLELHHEHGIPLRKMAVLYRNHAHSLELQVELTRRKIPYAVRSGMRFFEQAHIKDVVSYLRARENPRDALAWVRMLRLWPGVGMQTAEALAGHISGEGDGSPVARRDVLGALKHFATTAKGRAKPSIERLARIWELLENPEYESPAMAIRLVLERHYLEYAGRSFANVEQRAEDLEHLALFAKQWDQAQSFLSELALVQGITAENILSAEEPDDMLVLSTIHQAKGLEWPVVFVLWLAEGRFPAARSLKTRDELEEERRLFYVATTRAADELHLLYPTVEEGRQGPSKLLRPSRFLAEIDRAPPVFDRWEIEEAPLDE